MSELALKLNLADDQAFKYDENLHNEFLLIKSQLGIHYSEIAKEIGIVTVNGLRQYIKKKCIGDFRPLEERLAIWVSKKRNTGLPFENSNYLPLGFLEEGLTAYQVARIEKIMALIIGASGCGKTTLREEVCRRFPDTVLVVGDVTLRAIGPILDSVGHQLPVPRNHLNNSGYLQKIIDDLKGSGRLLVIDESHFLPWVGFEIFRKIHDCARVGIVFTGQETTYSQMQGRKGFLFDQIFSRISIRCQLPKAGRNDVGILAESIYPGLDKKCLDFLFQKALGRGQLRVMVNILERSKKVAEAENIPVSLDLLKEVSGLLLF